MAAKNSTDNNVVEAESAEDVKVPRQGQAKLEVVEVEAVDAETPSFSEKAKNVLRNKKVIAGVASVILIAAGALIVKKRSDATDEGEVVSD